MLWLPANQNNQHRIVWHGYWPFKDQSKVNWLIINPYFAYFKWSKIVFYFNVMLDDLCASTCGLTRNQWHVTQFLKCSVVTSVLQRACLSPSGEDVSLMTLFKAAEFSHLLPPSLINIQYKQYAKFGEWRLVRSYLLNAWVINRGVIIKQLLVGMSRSQFFGPNPIPIF